MSREAEATYFKLMGALLYNEPSEQAINTLRDEELFAEILYAGENGLVKEGQKLLANWLKSAPANELTDNARTDYMRLLVGAGKVLAPPWGSVYLDEDKLLFNVDTLKVRNFYQKYGVELKKKYSEPDDHIGLELEFLANLSEKGEVEAMKSFINDFMFPWIFNWNDDVQAHAQTDYYKGLANLAVGGVQHLCENIE